MLVKVPVSVGELLDKITILQIKAEKITDPSRQASVQGELGHLARVCEERKILLSGNEFSELAAVNRELWDVEDRIRAKDLEGDFGEEFIALARAVYRLNDQRFEFKRRLNAVWNSAIVEVKSYQQYQ